MISMCLIGIQFARKLFFISTSFRSHLYHDIIKGKAPKVTLVVNGQQFDFAYWLADGIYPEHACLVKTVRNPSTRKSKLFAEKQKGVPKDIEREFGILQRRFHVLTKPCELWDRHAMAIIIRACVILHNLIIDYEQVYWSSSWPDIDFFCRSIFWTQVILTTAATKEHPFMVEESCQDLPTSIYAQTSRMKQLQSKSEHKRLQLALIDYIWNRFGDENDPCEL